MTHNPRKPAMNLKLILSASAAALIAASAAQAQTVQGGMTGDVTGQAAGQLSGPADHTRSSTGLPSVDSTRPTGADAGRTMSGRMSGSAGMEAGAEMDHDGMSGQAGMSTTAQHGQMYGEARSAGAMGAMASSTAGAQVTTNGPIPDTEENRAKYGEPNSRAGKASAARGN